jgi:SAM-dependent methyltransferase
MTIDQQLAEWWLTNLETSARFDAPWVADAVAWLIDTSGRPEGSAGPRRVLDVGCGAGGAACAFARALGPGVVAGLDRDPRLLAIARRRATDAGLAGQILGWLSAGVDALPVAAASADLVWASGVVHHLPDQQAAIGTLAALLRPGGRLALVEGGLPLRCLPFDIGLGRVGLEARLDGARSRWFADMREELSGPPLPYGWPEALRRAGLADVRARSFLAEVAPPFDDLGRQVAERHLSSALSELGDRLAPDDRDTIARLLDPDDAAYIGRRDDLMITAVRTLNVGTAV